MRCGVEYHCAHDAVDVKRGGTFTVAVMRKQRVQRDLREATEEERRARRIERGLSELVRSTHVAPLEIRRMLLLAERAR